MLAGIISLAGVCAAGPVYISDQPDLIAFMAQGWGALGHGTSACMPGETPLPMKIKEKAYSKGLGSHAPGEIVIDLRGRYLSFEAEVGVQRLSAKEGSVVFQVFVDDKQVFDSGVMRQENDPVPIKVPLKGADELRLVVKDAGDGITCDCANWADARLTLDPNAKPASPPDRVDIGQFAQVTSWDASRMDGTHAGRTQEIPAEDLFLETEVLAGSDGSYAVPTNKAGVGCIGLQWLEPRQLRRLTVDFAAVPSPDEVRVEYWQTVTERGASSSSRWQGRWEPLKGEIRREGDTLVLDIDWSGAPDKVYGTTKVRWIVPASAGPVKAKRLSAYTDSRWATADVVLQAENARAGARAEVTAYNGEIVTTSGPAIRQDWDLSKPLKLKVRYGVPRRWMRDRSSLRIKLPGGGFGVAIDDLLNNGCVYVKDFGFFAAVEPVKENLAQYKKRTAKQKTILERVREMPDQTFEQAMKHVHRPEADLGPSLLSLACENHKYVLHRDGTIAFDLPDYPWETTGRKQILWRFNRSFGFGGEQKISRGPEDGWLPISNIRVEEGGATYRQRTFVAPFGDKPASEGSIGWLNRKPLCVSEFEIENPSASPVKVSAQIGIRPNSDTGELIRPDLEAGFAAFSSEGKLLAGVSASDLQGLTFTSDGKAVTIAGTLAPKATARFAAYIPGWYASKNELAGIKPDSALLDKTKSYWHRVTASEPHLEIPDEFLSNVIKASQVHCLLAARSEEDKRVAAWIGSVNYGPLESEAHSVIRGMLFTGNTEYARRSLEFFIHRYNPAGFLTTGYTVMGTGWHLWTLGEYYALTHDTEWMKSVAPEVARVCRWIMAQREKTKKLDARGEKVPEWGLMPPGVCADWSVYVYYHYINGNYYAGLKSAGEALADIGHPDAKAILASAAELRECTMRAYHWAQSQAPVFPLKDGAWVPMYPTQAYGIWPTNQMYPASDSGRSWCYDVEIGAHHLVPMGVMDPESKDAHWMMDHMEDVQFLADGWFYYPAAESEKDWFNRGGFAKVQPYYARTVEVYALQDEVKPFIRSYFNSVISLLNREDLSLWEHFVNGAFNKTHETGYFLHQSRTMLLTERGDDLWLAPFVTNQWMHDGQSVSLTDAITRFGKLSYKITSHVAQGYIEAVITPPDRESPREIVIRLRHPDGKPMKSVTVNGKKHTDFDPRSECVRVKPSGDKITIRATY